MLLVVDFPVFLLPFLVLVAALGGCGLYAAGYDAWRKLRVALRDYWHDKGDPEVLIFSASVLIGVVFGLLTIGWFLYTTLMGIF